MEYAAQSNRRRRLGRASRSSSRPSRSSFDPQVALVKQAVFAHDAEYQAYGRHALMTADTVEYLFAGEKEAITPQQAFDSLRWGGQFIYVAGRALTVREMATQLADSGFVVEVPLAHIWQGPQLWGWGIPGLAHKVHYLVARKTRMVMPGQYSDRFTYDVQLQPGAADGEKYVVVKRVPSMESLIDRLTQKFPDQPRQVIIDRARKMNQTVFPIFLTREAAFLKILQRDLPEADRLKVPRVLAMEKDERGMAQTLTLNWLRQAHEPMDQLEFAIQSARLLEHLHQRARIMHLDLRLDNFVISRHGVGFVDYGSAVRLDEKINDSPLLSQLFTEIMRTSQIQRMLEKMSSNGSVTSQVLTQSSRQTDPAVDLFYLAVQIDQPHSNPYIRELVRYEPHGRQARLIARLVQDILRPEDAHNPTYRTAGDVLRGLLDVRKTLIHEQAAEPASV